MKGIVGNPVRVYIVMAFFALIGVMASFRLPISLFPNAMQPQLWVSVPYGSLSAEEFRRLYGSRIESQLDSIKGKNLKLEKQRINYETGNFNSSLTFNWGAEPEQALRETQQIVQSIGATLPEESRRGIGVGFSRDSAFFAMSFYSKKRNLTELHKLLEPILIPPMKKIPDANDVNLWNPTSREIKVELKPDVMTSIGLPPQYIEGTIQTALGTQNAGSIENAGHSLPMTLKKQVQTLEDLRHVMIALPGGRHLPLGDIADVRFDSNSQWQQSFKTSGVSSLILFASPKQGGNVKAMAESILDIVHASKAIIPDDVEFRVLVDPSFYIRASIHSVMFEVGVGSLLASLVLFLFIGSLRNVITTAIEIPISIALAFIMMWLFDVNINLLSLAGLALAAGMNVDASVVVMENIFRHFEEHKGPLTSKSKLSVIVQAVEEVKLPVIASTLASLVVFLPFMFISGLSYAVLGDLAKAVIFSHGFSAIVALILVPTVRLHLLKRETRFHQNKALIEGPLLKLEKLYLSLLRKLIRSPGSIVAGFLAIVAFLVVAGLVFLPRLPKEIIGKPETDWVSINIETQGNTQLKQMEGTVQKIEHDVLQDLQNDIDYTFDEVNGANYASILARIKDKRRMKEVREKLEAKLSNFGSTRVSINLWNPSEFRIPEPPQIRVAVTGGDAENRLVAARDLRHILESEKVFDQVWTTPDSAQNASLEILPKREQWNMLAQDGFAWTPEAITDALRVASQGKWIGELMLDGQTTSVVMRYPEGAMKSEEDLSSFPLKVRGDLIPLRALADINRRETQQAFYVEEGREMALVFGKGQREVVTAKHIEKARKAILSYIEKDLPKLKLGNIVVQMEDPEKDLSDSMEQLGVAFVCSLGLIFLTMILQFGSVVEAFLVLAAVPMGLIGAIGSLYLFQSSLSVNAALGIIMLNGIAVNNSIILVDFARRLADQGYAPLEACLQAARQRLRPILITTLTTILGMMPIALGMGTGGRVLQPLGIAVGGGLGLSMLLTLFVVPVLQNFYLRAQLRRRMREGGELTGDTVLSEHS